MLLTNATIRLVVNSTKKVNSIMFFIVVYRTYGCQLLLQVWLVSWSSFRSLSLSCNSKRDYSKECNSGLRCLCSFFVTVLGLQQDVLHTLPVVYSVGLAALLCWDRLDSSKRIAISSSIPAWVSCPKQSNAVQWCIPLRTYRPRLRHGLRPRLSLRWFSALALAAYLEP